MSKKNQSNRLTNQHKDTKGVIGIFGEKAKLHDSKVGRVAYSTFELLKYDFPQLNFRFRQYVSKEEINAAMHKLDN